MKKSLTYILIILAISATNVTAVVAETDNQTQETTISTNIDPEYTVTIPANTEVTFNETKTSFGAIVVDSAQLAPDKCLKVTLTTDGKMENSADNTKVIPFEIKAGNNVFTSATYFAAGEKTDLTINITQDDWNKAYAGEYSDTVTFTISYEDKPNN